MVDSLTRFKLKDSGMYGGNHGDMANIQCAITLVLLFLSTHLKILISNLIIQWYSPNSNCSNSNIALLASYFLSPSEHLMLILFL